MFCSNTWWTWWVILKWMTSCSSWQLQTSTGLLSSMPCAYKWLHIQILTLSLSRRSFPDAPWRKWWVCVLSLVFHICLWILHKQSSASAYTGKIPWSFLEFWSSLLDSEFHRFERLKNLCTSESEICPRFISVVFPVAFARYLPYDHLLNVNLGCSGVNFVSWQILRWGVKDLKRALNCVWGQGPGSGWCGTCTNATEGGENWLRFYVCSSLCSYVLWPKNHGRPAEA